MGKNESNNLTFQNNVKMKLQKHTRFAAPQLGNFVIDKSLKDNTKSI